MGLVRIEKMIEMLGAAAQSDTIYFGGIDTAWAQMSMVSEEKFHKSLFLNTRPSHRNCATASKHPIFHPKA
jgi:hypothetical protein